MKLVTNSKRSLVLFLMLTLIACFPWEPVRAHGIGKPQQINVSSGPYLVSIWTDPDPLRVDEAHVVVAVMEPDTRRPLVEDVIVTVSLASSADSSQVVTGQADYSISTNRLLHAVEFNDLLRPGIWDGTVTVVGPFGPSEPVAFQMEVQGGRSANWLLIGGVGIGAIVALWLLLSLRRSPEPNRQTTTKQVAR